MPHRVPYSTYLELLDRHGRSALDALRGLPSDAEVPPHGTTAQVHAREHLATLEIWAWLLVHTEHDWRAYVTAARPPRYEDALGAIGRERDRLTRLLVDLGPDQELDYFGRPGTSYDVARLLAHEAISVAFAAGEARGMPAPPLHPDIASDCVDRALAHWSEPDADVDWQPAPAHLVAADTGRSWWVRFSGGREELGGVIAPGSAGPAALVVTDDACPMLRWLEGYPCASPRIEGDDATLRKLRVALGHRLEPEPRRAWWQR